MTVHDQLMTEWGQPALMEQHGTLQSVKFNPVSGESFTVDAILGSIRGDEQFTDVDQTTKFLNAVVLVRRSDFAVRGITEMPMMARIDAYGLTGWAIGMAESEWSGVWAKLGLERETLAREYQARRNAAV